MCLRSSLPGIHFCKSKSKFWESLTLRLPLMLALNGVVVKGLHHVSFTGCSEATVHVSSVAWATQASITLDQQGSKVTKVSTFVVCGSSSLVNSLFPIFPVVRWGFWRPQTEGTASPMMTTKGHIVSRRLVPLSVGEMLAIVYICLHGAA